MDCGGVWDCDGRFVEAGRELTAERLRDKIEGEKASVRSGRAVRVIAKIMYSYLPAKNFRIPATRSAQASPNCSECSLIFLKQFIFLAAGMRALLREE
jgi:hypothetical protein